ncbi:MAG: ATP citrate synthase [Nanoarchaeota archaeon]|nr:ATP citrate synthase [Nanoarchaeota archaeon]
MTRPDYILFDEDSESIIYNYQQNAIQRMLDFDFTVKRKKPSVSAIVNPNRKGLHKAFWGEKEILIPMYTTSAEALKKHPKIDVFINFASFRSAFQSTKEIMESKSIRTIVIIAEGIPERQTRELNELAAKHKKVIIGPATVGGISAGAFKIGNTAGTIDNIVASKLYRKGSVGFVSKSGGLSNEMYNMISLNSDGVYEGLAIGGDKFPGSRLIDHVMRYEKNPDIKMVVVLGEIGGDDEYGIVEALKEKKITKPLVAWVTGTCAKIFSAGIQFGHAGAATGKQEESADAKNKALKEAGAIVPNSYDDFDAKIKKTFEKLKSAGKIKAVEETEPPKMPMDYAFAAKAGLVRKPANFICTISDDRGEEATYHGTPISEVIKDGSIGKVISLLWFKKDLPLYAQKFIELVIMTVADHGPCVSGAHNAIVTARAGKDLMSAVASGILTIGPRFGGAIDGAAKFFKEAYDRKLTPQEFIDEMKAKGILIQGIGHKIKSITNPDKRVDGLKDFAKKNFKTTELLDFALKVEQLTTRKKNNLILNVDGCIGILMVDMMKSTGEFTEDEITEFINLGIFNAFFILGRSIGMIGHALDQYRLQQGLYRHPQDDVCYM